MQDLNDWTKLTNDPVDDSVRSKVIDHLLKIRKKLPSNCYDTYLIQQVKNQRVLDVGICEHIQSRMESKGWKHALIMENAEYSLGVDILEDLVEKLQARGVNAVVCDATSKKNIGEKFDVIHVGDVIEHVNSPVDLMNFCLRHLNDNGKIIVRTPNPYCFNYVNMQKKVGTDKSNLEHMFYICPIHAMEIARRSSLKLLSYYTLSPKGVMAALKLLAKLKFRHAIAELTLGAEQYSTIYVYEFVKA